MIEQIGIYTRKSNNQALIEKETFIGAPARGFELLTKFLAAAGIS